MASKINCTSPSLPYYFYTIPFLLLCIVGCVDSGYLAWLHYQNYSNLSFTSFCALSKSINCDTVAQSPWSIFFGFPLAWWGLFGYLIFLVVSFPLLKNPTNKDSLWYVLFSLAFLYSGISLYLAYISSALIKAHCILCMASYTVNFLLLFNSLIIIRRFCKPFSVNRFIADFRKLSCNPVLTTSLLFIFIFFISIRFALPQYWIYAPPPITKNLEHGITEKGNPWIGAKQPLLTIHEYADYQCFQCSKMHLFIRRLVMLHPAKIRLVHHHYPMDHAFNNLIVPEPFHIGSGKMAMIAIYAASQNKFWEMNDALYKLGRTREPFNTRTLEKLTGINSGELAAATRHQQIKDILLYDIRQGMKLKITGTPTFVIDGEVYAGAIPAEILRPYL